MSKELKQCPFCGEPAEKVTIFAKNPMPGAACYNPACWLHRYHLPAIFWNTRALSPEVKALLDAARNALHWTPEGRPGIMSLEEGQALEAALKLFEGVKP